MNVAVIFAGGTGKRMGQTDKPKQFIEISEKPIMIHTLEIFEKCDAIDAMVVVCIEGWVDYLKDLLNQYNITKVKDIVLGGETGQLSIFHGVERAYQLFPEDTTILIHDGVRPFINHALIKENIKNVKERKSAISCVYSTETFTIIDDDKNIIEIPERIKSLIAKAPQSFILKDIYDVHIQAQKDGIYDSIDSCTLMNYYKRPLSVVMTDYDNIKITTPKDIILAESIYKRILNNDLELK